MVLGSMHVDMWASVGSQFCTVSHGGHSTQVTFPEIQSRSPASPDTRDNASQNVLRPVPLCMRISIALAPEWNNWVTYDLTVPYCFLDGCPVTLFYELLFPSLWKLSVLIWALFDLASWHQLVWTETHIGFSLGPWIWSQSIEDQLRRDWFRARRTFSLSLVNKTEAQPFGETVLAGN